MNRVEEIMNNLLGNLALVDKNTLYLGIGVSVLVLILVLYFLKRSIDVKKLRKKLLEFENRYNNIKSAPLLFKLNKAVALARVNDEVNKVIDGCRNDFEKVQDLLKQASTSLGEIDDSLYLKKVKVARKEFNNLSGILDEVEASSLTVMEMLDHVLQQENIQREQINVQKEEFRALKKYFNDNSGQYDDAYPVIEEKIVNIEEMFSLFEEWMFASEFNKASHQQVEIIENIKELTLLKEHLPALFEKAKGVLPTILEHTVKNYTNARNLGLNIEQYEVSQNLEVISSLLQTDLTNLKNAKIDNVLEHLIDCEKRLAQINEGLNKELAFHVEITSGLSLIDDRLITTKEQLIVVNDLYINVKTRFGFEDLDAKLADMANVLDDLINQRYTIKADIEASSKPFSIIHISYRQLTNDLDTLLIEIEGIQNKLDVACADEHRAQKQLVKLQVILNDIKISINKNNLPNVSIQYEEDLETAKRLVNDVVEALACVPLDANDMNNKVQIAIDFVYKLYNNVNNLVGVAALVEETITLGNRYRSTLPEVESQLTRAELCFRNGEYTKAFKIALSTIEKIHPGAYDKILAKQPIHI